MRRSSAIDRTVSLFTGKADEEDKRARDGSRASPRERPAPPPRYRQLRWIKEDGGMRRWRSACGYYPIEHLSYELYVVKYGAKELTRCKNILSGSAAAQRHLDGT